MSEAEKVLLTGAAGFIGRNVGAELIKRGYAVYALDDMSNGSYVNLLNLDYKGIAFGGAIGVDSLFPRIKFDHVIHLGAISSTSASDFGEIQYNNITTTLHLEEKTAHRGRKSFVYASSAACYGNTGYFVEPHETSDFTRETPHNLYGFSKWYVDREFSLSGFSPVRAHTTSVIRGKQGEYDSRIIGLRYFNVYGPHEEHKGGMISFAKRVFDKHGQAFIFKHSKHKMERDFIHVDDATRMTIDLMESECEGGIYNVGTGISSTWRRVYDSVIDALGSDLDFDEQELPQTLQPYQYFTCADMSKTSKYINTKTMSVYQGVRKYIEWLKDNG